MKKTLKIAIIVVLFFLLGFTFTVVSLLFHSNPRLKGEIRLKGLDSEVRVFWDEWGVPHIFSANEKDLFFACGFIHARERIWQMDLMRRTGFGRLSEIFGKVSLEKDRLLRTLGLKEAAGKSYESLSPQMRDVLLYYSHGINAWMETRQWNWPPEFTLLRYRPEPWSPLDSLVIKEVMAFLLCRDYGSEALRAKLVRRLGSQKALEILEEELKHIPSEIQTLFLNQENLSSGSGGSNNWVVDGSRTVSGKPLLANDPHLEITLPPIWYEVHLHSPTVNVTGVSIPGIPVVIIGHNESLAWGITNSAADVQDLYVERLNETQDAYLDSKGWKSLQKKEEIIGVKGKEPVTIEVSWTERGPLIAPVMLESDTPYSLRWVIYEGGKALECFYLLNKAQNWDDFARAIELFDSPSQNFVYADRYGNIGYYLSGKIPIRKQESALFPYPGWKEDGKWQGFLEEARKPNLLNPEAGFIVTANNRIIPEDYPFYVSVDWDAPFRAERIKDLLLQREKHTVETIKAIQNDVLNKKGLHFLALIKEMEPGEKQEKWSKAQDILKDWDGLMSSGQAPALLEIFMNVFIEETFKDELGKDFQDFDLQFRRKKAGILRILSDPRSHWFDRKDTPQQETRDEIVRISLERTFRWLEEKFGPPETWDWEKIHSLKYEHVLGKTFLFRFLNRGPYPVEGDAFTVKSTYSPDYQTRFGSSCRLIVDLSDWEKSVCVLSSGQSGHFLSRHYDDQINLWLNGDYHPMLFDRSSIEAKARQILMLTPY